jgi:putative ABC transport system permease protein
MVATDIGWAGVVASLSLVVLAVLLSLVLRLGLERSMVWATVRAAVQLALVGTALGVVLDPERPVAWAWLWVGAMVIFAAATVRRRAPGVPGVLPIALIALGVVATVSLSVVFGLGIFPVEPVAIVPIAGMMIGNSLTSTVLAATRVTGELGGHRLEVEARLALGHPWQDAARPFVRRAVRTAMVPQIEATKAVGLVILPGAMTGLILAGVDPFDAVMVQAAIMFLILGSVATSVTVVGLGVSRRCFTADHRMVRIATSSSS